MSNRGLYKKTQTGWDRTQENEREREKRLYDKISQSPEPVKTRKKSVKKGKKKANHKHEYVDAILFEREKVADSWLSRYKNKGFQPVEDETSLDIRVGKVCSICGEEEKNRSWRSLFRSYEPIVPLRCELPQFEKMVGEKLFKKKDNPIPLKKIFVDGSQTFSVCGNWMLRTVDSFCLANCGIIVSDAQGIGGAIREYLKRREYVNVKAVPKQKIEEELTRCDLGVIYLKGYTNNELQKIEKLLSQGKPCYVQMIEPISVNKIFSSIGEWKAFVKAYKLNKGN